MKPGREICSLSPTSLRSPDSWVGPEGGRILCQSQRKEARRAARASRDRDPSYFKTGVSRCSVFPSPAAAMSRVQGAAARQRRMLRSIYPRGRGARPHLASRPRLGYGWWGPVFPSPPRSRGGQLESLSEWQSSGSALWLPFRVVAELPRSLILFLHQSPEILIARPTAPSPASSGCRRVSPQKSCSLAASGSLMEP